MRETIRLVISTILAIGALVGLGAAPRALSSNNTSPTSPDSRESSEKSTMQFFALPQRNDKLIDALIPCFLVIGGLMAVAFSAFAH